LTLREAKRKKDGASGMRVLFRGLLAGRKLQKAVQCAAGGIKSGGQRSPKKKKIRGGEKSAPFFLRVRA
jgi:hypothetical protein